MTRHKLFCADGSEGMDRTVAEASLSNPCTKLLVWVIVQAAQDYIQLVLRGKEAMRLGNDQISKAEIESFFNSQLCENMVNALELESETLVPELMLKNLKKFEEEFKNGEINDHGVRANSSEAN